MKASGILTAVILLGVIQSSASAGHWCDNFDGTIAPLAVFCDDFDTYCPTNNNPCAQDQNYNPWISHAWPRTSWSYHNNQNEVCGNEIIFSNVQAQLTTIYHGAVMMDGGDEGGILGQSTRSMTDGIHAKFGSQYNQVLGTDEAPLVLQFDMASGIQSAAGLQLSNGFVELAMEEHTLTKQEFLALGYDPEVSPADYIKVGGVESGTCISCRGECAAMLAARGMPDDGRAPHHAWPTVCQSYDARVQGSLCLDPADPTGPPIPCPPPYCPETPPDKLHKTLAIGAFAMLDPNPCHCENPVKPDNSHCGPGFGCNTVAGFCNGPAGSPGSSTPCTTDADCPREMPEYTNHTATNHHLAFFDGWKWRSLRSKIFDPVDGIPGVVGSGDFIMGSKIDQVRLTIKTSTVRIDHWRGYLKWTGEIVNGTWMPYAGDPLCDPDARRNDTIAGGITITNAGSGYTSAPAVTIAPPTSSPSRQATATAIVSDGVVTAITITDPGMGYASAPAVTIAPPAAGIRATATATLGGAAHYEPGAHSWADNIPRKYFGAFNVIRLGNPSSCRLCSSDLVSAGGDYANCAAGSWNGTAYTCTEFNQNWGSGATWCKRMSGINGCYGTNIDDGSNFVTVDTLAVTGGAPEPSIGACCKPDATCAVMLSTDCAAAGGTFRGNNVPCDSTTCLGACCQPMGVCTHTLINGCSPTDYKGAGTDCATAGCVLCATPFADVDGDGDVDQMDFGVFQGCFGGSGVAVTGFCDCFDRHPAGAGDEDVDMDDLDMFEACASGPGIALDPNCDL